MNNSFTERKTLFVDENGKLVIGGKSAEELVKKYGTPLYVFDKTHIEDVCRTYKDSLKKYYGEGLVCYASKAFCCKEIYRIVGSVGLGADFVSGGELYTAKSVDFPCEKLVFHGNNKTEKEIIEAVSYGVGRIVIDSVSEAEFLSDICSKTGKVQDVLLRVNVGVEAHTHHFVQTATPDSKFGFSLSNGDGFAVTEKILKMPNLRLVGYHSHIGSQIFDTKAFLIAIEKLARAYKSVKNTLGVEFGELNLGGGIGIRYTYADPVMKLSDYEEFVKMICEKVKSSFSDLSLKLPFLILEPGRSIVGEAGVTLYSVGNVKKIKGVKNYVAVDGGMFDNPRFALYQAKYSAILAGRANDKVTGVYSIAGKCCESGDIICEDVSLPEPKKGDVLAVFSTGAYNYSMASNYNRNCIPPVVMVSDGKDYPAVKGQTYDDIMKNDI